MKPMFPLIAAFGWLLTSCTKEPTRPAAPEVPVTKTIAFNLYTIKDYSQPFYDQSFAEVRLSIGKISLRNNTAEIIWDTTYSFRPFGQYPQVGQMIQIEKRVQHYENSEVLQTSAVVRYKVDGYSSMEAKGDPVQRSERYKLVTITF